MTDYVAHRGLRIAYDIAGSGDEAVALLHGLADAVVAGPSVATWLAWLIASK